LQLRPLPSQRDYRRGFNWVARYPRIVEALHCVPVRSIVIDGEAVVCGNDGKSEFDQLHSGAHDAAVFLFAFDLIELDGDDLRPAPLEQRKGKLEKLLAHSDGIRFSEHLDGNGTTIFAHACKLGLEGIVSKRRDLPYRSGRCRAWVKGQEPGEPGGVARQGRDVATGPRAKSKSIACQSAARSSFAHHYDDGDAL
jgi:ATP-dependent DNA ligase